jgi:hypothetical protein
MPVTVNIAPAIAVLERVQATYQNAPGLMATAADRRYRKVRPLILADAKTSDRRPAHPLKWSIDPTKQKRAMRWWFANRVPKGSKGGGRYARTGALDKATKVTGSFSRSGGVITLGNKVPGSEFVFGAKQIPSFIGLHPRFDDVAAKWNPILSQQLSEDWYTVTDARAGVR